jgi:hypothetical protein
MAAIRKTGARVTRWFKSLKGKKRTTTRRWHEHHHQIYNV